MNLFEAAKLAQTHHVLDAARRVDEHEADGVKWLLRQTGRSQPRTRYVVVEGRRYPTKAFGFLVAQLAGDTVNTSNDMTVAEAAQFSNDWIP